jgi:hypothetical protein
MEPLFTLPSHCVSQACHCCREKFTCHIGCHTGQLVEWLTYRPVVRPTLCSCPAHAPCCTPPPYLYMYPGCTTCANGLCGVANNVTGTANPAFGGCCGSH